MTNHCDFNTNLECGCDHKCRVELEPIPLIHPPVKMLTKVMVVAALVTALALSFMSAEEFYKRQDIRMQEVQ